LEVEQCVRCERSETPATGLLACVRIDWYIAAMTSKALKAAMRRVETWPEEAQQELADIALEIDASLKGGTYQATPKELEGIDRGLKAAREGRFAADEQVEAVIAKHRRS
jgi:predicted transcriptional regulator